MYIDKISYKTWRGSWSEYDVGPLIANAKVRNHIALVDDLQAIVNNFSDYYNKTDVDSMIAAISTLNLEVVEELPTENISHTTIYLKGTETTGTNDYEEWIYTVNNDWELIGSTQVDLSNYIQKTDIGKNLALNDDGTIDAELALYIPFQDSYTDEERDLYYSQFLEAYEQKRPIYITKTEWDNGNSNRYYHVTNVTILGVEEYISYTLTGTSVSLCSPDPDMKICEVHFSVNDYTQAATSMYAIDRGSYPLESSMTLVDAQPYEDLES